MQNNFQTAQHARSAEKGILSSVERRAVLSTTKPYFLSSMMLSLYVFSIVVLSKNPALTNLSQFAGFALAGVFAFEYLKIHKGKIMLPVEFFGFWAFLSLMIISGLWAPEQIISITLSMTFVQLLIFGIIAANIMTERGSIKPVVFGLLAGLLWAVFAALNEQNFAFMAPAAYLRIGGILFNANSYAVSLLIGCMFAWYLFQNYKSSVFRFALIALIMLFMHQIVFYSGSRKGILGVILVFPVYLLLRQLIQSKRSPIRFFLTILLIAGFIIVGWWIIEQSVFYNRMDLFDFDLTESMRGQMAKFGLDLWRDRPLLGQGAGQFSTFFFYRTYSHNNYVEILANNGLIGFLAFYSFFVLLVQKYLHLFQRGRLTINGLSWLLSLIFLLLLLDMGMVSYYEKSTWIAFIVLVSACYIYRPVEEATDSTIKGVRQWHISPPTK